MSDAVANAGRKLRPHVKAHKSTEIARRQLAAGAVGLCCATVREAEVMAAAGLDGILVTTPVVAPTMIGRLVAARQQDGRPRCRGRQRGRRGRAGGAGQR